MQTLESLLDIASSKARKGDRSGLKQVDLRAMVTRICELYAGSAEESGHSLNWSIEPEVMLFGEEEQLSRIVTNLLDNALKYTPAGGRFDVELEAGPLLSVCDCRAPRTCAYRRKQRERRAFSISRELTRLDNRSFRAPCRKRARFHSVTRCIHPLCEEKQRTRWSA